MYIYRRKYVYDELLRGRKSSDIARELNISAERVMQIKRQHIADTKKQREAERAKARAVAIAEIPYILGGITHDYLCTWFLLHYDEIADKLNF